MSSAHVLLSSLQDRSKLSEESCCTMLAELLSFCRYDELKSDVANHGIDTLLALARDEALIKGGDATEALLELLSTLVLDNHAARALFVQKGVLHVALDAIDSFLDKKPSKKRNKIVKLALEMVDQWSCVEERQRMELQETVITRVLRILENTTEDWTILLHAAEVLGCMLERNAGCIQTVAKLDGISILLRLLGMPESIMGVKRSVCEALLIMSDASGMIQVMASDNTTHALCICLRAQVPGRDVECTAIRLLQRLSEEAQFYGQIINEDMLPLLFHVVDRNCNLLEVAAPACAILERLSRFARDCKLELSSFFVNISYNPVDLPLLINSETIEGLLALYILNGSSGSLSTLSADLVQILSSLSRSTIESFSLKDDNTALPPIFLCLRNHYDNLRFASQVFALLTKYWRDRAKSVHSITGFVGIAVDILCRYARTSLALCDEMMEIYNFLREVLLSKDGVDVVLSCGGKVLCETLRHTPVGSNQNYRALTPSKQEMSGFRRSTLQKSQLPLQITSEVNNVAGVLMVLLEKAASVTPEERAKSPGRVSRRIRDGDEEYEEYVTKILRKERSCLFKAFDSGALKPSSNSVNLATPLHPSGSTNESPRGDCGEAQSECISNTLAASGGSKSGEDGSGSDCENECNDQGQEDEPDATVDDGDDAECEEGENEGNDDGSDGDGSEDDCANVDINLELESLTSEGNQIQLDEETKICDNDGSTEQLPAGVSAEMKPSPPKTFTVKGWSDRVDFSKYKETEYYFESPLGMKYPKHPSRCGSLARDDQEDDAFAFGQLTPNEPCKASHPDVMSAFIEQAISRRQQFLQSDPSVRAQLVYDSKSHFENLGGATGAGPTKNAAAVDPFPYHVPKKSDSFQDNNDSLTFDSCFESGNLERAVQIGEWEYDLFLRRDFNTSGHMQWFCFAVSNIRARGNGAATKYRFNIVNLCKPDSLFNQGLQPVVYSVKDAHQKRTGWLRSGTEIYYFSNPFPRSPKCATKVASSNNEGSADTGAQSQTAVVSETYFTLTFMLEFANTDDTYLVAHSYPYTLTDHDLHLERILSRSGRNIQHILRRSVLCKTLSGKNCDLLTISDFSSSTQEQKARRAVVISSRVHPGEAQASWMMRGVIDFLVGESDVARVLRRLFVFQIIPILNPDGVYYGNSRCSLSACDLNRQWHNPSPVYHPTIFHAKELLKKEYSSRGVVFFCDLHGHSRKKNVFMYGCDTKKRPNPRSRAFAKLFSMQQTAKKYISFPDCSFKISKSKETTARVVVANELKLCWCFTLEASFCGGSFGELQGMHYNTHHMSQVGSSLCETLLQASISDGNVRERLSAMVDDYSVNMSGYVESQLRENGIVSDTSGPSAFRRELGAATPRKAKAAAGGGARRSSDRANSTSSKAVQRKSSSSKSSKLLRGGDTKTEQHPSSRTSKPERRHSKSLNRQRTLITIQQSEIAEIREVNADMSSPRPYLLSSDTQVQDHLSLPRAKMSGKKLRNKKKKVKKKSYPDGESDKHQGDTMPSIATYSSHVQEADRKVANIGRGINSSSSSSSTSSGASTPLAPTKPPAGCSGVSGVLGNSSIRSSTGCLQLADSILTIISKPPAQTLPEAYTSDFQIRETASVILPPPVGDLIARSPKLKPSSVRFRGAGRQFAAVSPVRQNSLKDIMRSESIRYTTYDQDLLSASAMAIRQRSSISASNNGFPQSRPVKLAPATSTSPYLSFPSVT